MVLITKALLAALGGFSSPVFGTREVPKEASLCLLFFYLLHGEGNSKAFSPALYLPCGFKTVKTDQKRNCSNRVVTLRRPKKMEQKYVIDS